MEIKTKYGIDEDVYLCFLEEDGLIRVARVKVDEIVIANDGVNYYTKPWIGDSWKEDDFVTVGNPELLYKKVRELNKKFLEEEENE